MSKKSLYIGGILVFILFLFSFLVLFPRLESKKSGEQDTSVVAPNPTGEPKQETVEENNLNQQMLYSSELAVPEANEENRVKFTNGEAAWDDGVVRGNATFGSNFAQVFTNEGYNFINDIYVNTGGSGTFAYIALYRYFADATTLSDYDFLGDRIQVSSVEVSTDSAPNGEYVIEVSYKARGEDEAMSAEPTIPVTVTYSVSGHKLTKVE